MGSVAVGVTKIGQTGEFDKQGSLQLRLLDVQASDIPVGMETLIEVEGVQVGVTSIASMIFSICLG